VDAEPLAEDEVVRILSVLAAVAAAVALAGCGGSDDDDEHAPPPVSSDQRAILEMIDALQTASRQGDAATICGDIFTDSLARSIRKASRRSCEKEVAETLVSPDAQIAVGRQIDVDGSRATATVRDQSGKTSTVSLVKTGDHWRIARITPAGS
jgi:hypothetical protein